jgi:hypothetical protein
MSFMGVSSLELMSNNARSQEGKKKDRAVDVVDNVSKKV